MMKCSILLTAILSLITLPVQSKVIVDIYESGNDLIIYSAGGSLDISTLTYGTSFSSESEFDYGRVGFIGYYNSDVNAYTGGITTIKSARWTQGTSFALLDPGGTSTAILCAEFYSGLGSPTLLVPSSFSSGDSISSIDAQISSFSLADASLTLGESIRYEWDSTSGAESLTFNVVPESSTVSLLGIGVFASVFVRRCKDRRRLSKVPRNKTKTVAEDFSDRW